MTTVLTTPTDPDLRAISRPGPGMPTSAPVIVPGVDDRDESFDSSNSDHDGTGRTADRDHERRHEDRTEPEWPAYLANQRRTRI